MSQLQHHYLSKHRHGKSATGGHKKESQIARTLKHALAKAQSKKRLALLHALDSHLKTRAVERSIAARERPSKFENEPHRKFGEEKIKPSHPAYHRLLRVRK